MTPPPKRSGLGRGLASLDPHRPERRQAAAMGPRMGDAAADVMYGGAPSRTAPSSRRRRRCRVPRDRPGGHRAEPEAAAPGVRRGGARRTRALDPRVRSDAADRGARRRPGRGQPALPAGDGGAALARRPGGRPGGHPGDRPGDRRRQHAARRAAGEHPPGAAEPVGRGGGLSAAARRVRRHPRGTRRRASGGRVR